MPLAKDGVSVPPVCWLPTCSVCVGWGGVGGIMVEGVGVIRHACTCVVGALLPSILLNSMQTNSCIDEAELELHGLSTE